jgi:hypothetical protein
MLVTYSNVRASGSDDWRSVRVGTVLLRTRIGATLIAVLAGCVSCGSDAQPRPSVEQEVPWDAGAKDNPENPLNRPDEASSRLCYGGCDNLGASRPAPLERPLCPSIEPIIGQGCTSSSLTCSYGDSVVSWCRRHYECRNDSWQEPEAVTGYDPDLCSTHPPNACPERPPHETPCEVLPVEQGSFVPCEYPGLTCWCEAPRREAGIPGTWQCYGPPLDESCPSTLPNVGEGCATPGVECNYVPDGCYTFPFSTVFCFEGQWESIPSSLLCAN